MKNIFQIFSILFISLFLFSCSDDDDNPSLDQNPTEDLRLVKQMNANGHTIELYSDNSQFLVGYNDVYIRIKDASGSYVDNFQVNNWMPKMNMAMHSHACPYSQVTNTNFNSMKKGYIVFTMPSNETEYWELTLNYSISGQEFTANDTILVNSSGSRRRVMNFTGSDETTYIVAYVNPKNPKVAVNDMEALLFKKESMMSFPLVENYTLKLDPRMPGMGNHSSPNNRDLTFDAAHHIYKGKLSLTMTGYWKLNLKVLDQNQNWVAGTDITDSNESSTVYLEIEF